MSKNYDNWEKLVGAVLNRDKLRQLALSHSVSSSSISDDSSCFSFDHHSLVLTHDDATYSICKRSLPGKVVFLPVEAREFSIQTEDYPEHAHSFSYEFTGAVEVIPSLSIVEVKPSLLIDIRGKINTRLLTSNTIYGAYLFLVGCRGFEAKAMITFINEETDVDAERQARRVQLVNGGREVALGSFYVGERDEREVEARLVKTSYLKADIIVEGIEFRPLVNVKQLDLSFN